MVCYISRSRDPVNERKLVVQNVRVQTCNSRHTVFDMQNSNLTTPPKNQCSQSKCKALLPAGYQYKTCEKCRSASKLSMQKKRKQKQEKADKGSDTVPATSPHSTNLQEIEPISDTHGESRVCRSILHFQGTLTKQIDRKMSLSSLRTRTQS